MKLNPRKYSVVTILLVLFILMTAEEYGTQARLAGDSSPIDDSSLFEFLQGKGDDDLRSFLEGVMERDVEPERPDTGAKIDRKASEDKFMGDAQSLSDMELFYSYHFDVSPWNWDIPEWPPVPWGYGAWPPFEYPPADEITVPGWYLHGCWISCFPSILYCDKHFVDCTITTNQYISSVEVIGQATSFLEGNQLTIIAFETDLNSVIEIKVCTAATSVGEKAGCCTARILLEGCGCDCLGVPPTIVADSTTEAANGDICDGGSTSGKFYVNSNDLACPPYEWELNYPPDGCVGDKKGGNNFLLNGQQAPATATTNSEGETVTVSSSGACGGAILTVTDQCGVSETYNIRCSDSGSYCSTCAGSDCCLFHGNGTLFASGPGYAWFENSDGYRRQTQLIYNTVSSCDASCSGSICNAPNFPCSGLVNCATVNYGCTSCLTVSWLFVGTCTSPASIYTMCDCHTCHDGVNNWDCCGCFCTGSLDYTEWKCP